MRDEGEADGGAKTAPICLEDEDADAPPATVPSPRPRPPARKKGLQYFQDTRK